VVVVNLTPYFVTPLDAVALPLLAVLDATGTIIG
jgi:hypothetical protein